uniref:PadR family transcriptional regulator n=1 Tax=Cellulomonas massiliensis TaxID=1465811 RepID=UPI00037BC337
RGPHGPGRRAGRGDIRAAVLLLLSEQPMHGYQLIQEIAQRSGGRWRPSPGAIYPALQLLEDEGLVTITAEQGRKLARLTEAGGTYVTQHADELGTPFDDAATRPQHPGRALRDGMEALGAAAAQVARTGTEQQAAAAVAVLERARRDLYLVLAGEQVADAPADAPVDAADDEDDES